jgi:hypothetical protein
MSEQNMISDEPDPDGKWLYRVGGISALLIGIGYIIIIVLFVPMGATPSGAEAWLTYVADNTTLWWAIIGLSVLTDFLFIPLALSLYFALKGINRKAMLLAAACMGLFVVLDLTLTQINYAALTTLSSSYAAAPNNAQRALIIAAAHYPSVVLESILLFVYNTLTLSVGILITALVMLKGIFGKGTAYLGLVTSTLDILAVAGSFFVSTTLVTVIASVLTTIWVLFVGHRLYRINQL